MAENINANISTTLREFIQKMNSADRMLDRRERRLDTLRQQVEQQDRRLQLVQNRLGRFAVSAGRQLGSGILTLGVNTAITQSGLETGGFFGRLAIGVGTGLAFGGGLPGAVVAGLTVVTSELIQGLARLGERVAKVEERAAQIGEGVKKTIEALNEQSRKIDDEIRKVRVKLGEEFKKDTEEGIYQVMRAQLVGDQ